MCSRRLERDSAASEREKETLKSDLQQQKTCRPTGLLFQMRFMSYSEYEAYWCNYCISKFKGRKAAELCTTSPGYCLKLLGSEDGVWRRRRWQMSSEPSRRHEVGVSLISLGCFFLCTRSVIALGHVLGAVLGGLVRVYKALRYLTVWRRAGFQNSVPWSVLNSCW